MKKKNFSIKYRVVTRIFALLVPLVLLLGVMMIFQINEANKQLITSERTNLNLIVMQLEEEMDMAEKHLYNTAIHNKSFRAMSGNLDDASLFAYSYEVLRSEDNPFNNSKNLSFMFIYSEANKYYADRDNGLDYLQTSEKTALRKAVKKRFMRFFLEGNSLHRKWFAVEIAERWFLGRVVYSQGMFCAVVYDLEEMKNRLELQIKDGCMLVFRDESELYTSFEYENIPLDWNESNVKISNRNKYMLLNEHVGPVTLSYLVPYEGLSGRLGLIILLACLVLVAVNSIPVFFFRIRKDFFKPLDNLVDTMRQVRDGTTEELEEDGQVCKEFKEVNLTFNQMLAQIKNLKIEQYEKEIKVQKAQLSFLQAQIRPHFYLNCLKVIYSLAQQRQFEDIKSCVLLVSKHFRYVFQGKTDTVALKDEVEMCENYVDLCRLMSNVKLRIISDVDEGLWDVQIPPISLLSLVENSIRVNMSPDSELEIRIRARKILTEEGPLLFLLLKDNGIGFTKEQLEKYNSEEWIEINSEHIGLQNVVRRFKIIYKEKFTVAFVNQEGAVVEFYVPLEEKEIVENVEAIDCG